MLMRRQFVLTLILMPITFGIWYAAGALFSAPAVWLCDALLQAVYPHLIDLVWLQGMKMGALTQFGMLEDEVVAASAAGNQIELEINTRLVSYSIAFYAALLMASNLQTSTKDSYMVSHGALLLFYYPGNVVLIMLLSSFISLLYGFLTLSHFTELL